MAWETLPVVSAVRLEHWNELIAAVNERNDEMAAIWPHQYLPGAVPVADYSLEAIDTMVPRVGHLTALRSKVEGLLPHFVDPTTGHPWTKAACFAAAFGKSDWSTPTPNHKKAIRCVHVNEMKQVLDLLSHFMVKIRYDSGNWNVSVLDVVQTGADLDTIWAAIKASYAAAGYPAGSSFYAHAGIFIWARTGPGYKYYTIDHLRSLSIPFDIPSFAADVTETKLSFRSGTSPTTLDEGSYLAYLQADFAGPTYAFTVPAATPVGAGLVVPVPTQAKGSTVYASFRTTEDHLAGATLDLYRPTLDASRNRSVGITPYFGQINPFDFSGGLMVGLGFDYLD